MNNDKLFSEFENLAEKLGLKILKGKGDFIGGICTVNNKTVIVVNKQKPMEQRLKTIANSLVKLNLEEIFIVPAVRDYIENQRTEK